VGPFQDCAYTPLASQTIHFARTGAATAPDRVSKLVLLSPLGFWRDDAPVRNGMIVTPATELPQYLFADPSGPVAHQMFEPLADPAQPSKHRSRWSAQWHARVNSCGRFPTKA
jgi:hypothetical protein